MKKPLSLAGSNQGVSMIVVMIFIVLISITAGALQLKINNIMDFIRQKKGVSIAFAIGRAVNDGIGCSDTFKQAIEKNGVEAPLPCSTAGTPINLISLTGDKNFLANIGIAGAEAFCKEKGSKRFIDIKFPVDKEESWLSQQFKVKNLPCHDYLNIGPKIVFATFANDPTAIKRSFCNCGSPRVNAEPGCHRSFEIECPEGYKATSLSVDCEMTGWNTGYVGGWVLNGRKVQGDCCSTGKTFDDANPNSVIFKRSPSATCVRMQTE